MLKFTLKQYKQRTNLLNKADNLLDKRYQELVDNRHIQSDDGQLKVLGYLQQLLNRLPAPRDNDRSIFVGRLILTISSFQDTGKSIYIHGNVGGGKSMLMDLFFNACPVETKRRIHFHAFMQEIHENIHLWRQQGNKGDPLPSLAKKIQEESLLLCFDEFHVTDIADAMLMARLFTYLLDYGVIFVATSNQHPDDLYKNGLQRELFLPFIELLKKSSEVIKLSAKEDYRLAYFKSIETIFYLKSTGKEKELLLQRFNELTNQGNMEPIDLHVNGRLVSFSSAHGDILFSSFYELCGRSLGPADYLEVADEFNIIFIADIPDLSSEIRDQARRFVTLIDALYENNVKIICSVDVPVEQLKLEDSSFDIKRTRSRLIEMQSEKYFNGSEAKR